MIDKLVLRCDFMKGWIDFDLRELAIPLEASIDPDGETHSVRHAWESIPSSFGSLAMKVFYQPTNIKHPDPWLEIKASPAKIMQGHNVFGSDDLGKCAYALIETLYKAYPGLVGDLDPSSWTVAEIDITYHSRADSCREASQFITALQHVSKGQTKSRTGYIGTTYFGKKNSRIKKIKVYDKCTEVIAYMEREKRRGDPLNILQYYTPELLKWTEGMIRWEVSLKTRWLERRGFPTSLQELRKVFAPTEMWSAAMSDIFSALQGKDMRLVTDEDVLESLKIHFHTVNTRTGKASYGAAMSAYRTYRAIKTEGWEQIRAVSTSSTLSRHIKMLETIGFSRARLQTMRGQDIGGEIVPMVRYIEVNFETQLPYWCQTLKQA